MGTLVAWIITTLSWMALVQNPVRGNVEIKIPRSLSTPKLVPGGPVPGGSDANYCNVSKDTDLLSIQLSGYSRR
jgi:hypothetical protein